MSFHSPPRAVQVRRAPLSSPGVVFACLCRARGGGPGGGVARETSVMSATRRLAGAPQLPRHAASLH